MKSKQINQMVFPYCVFYKGSFIETGVPVTVDENDIEYLKEKFNAVMVEQTEKVESKEDTETQESNKTTEEKDGKKSK